MFHGKFNFMFFLGFSQVTNSDADEQRGIVKGDVDAEWFISDRTNFF